MSILDFKRINFEVEVDNKRIGAFDAYSHNIEEEFWLTKEVSEIAASHYRDFNFENEDSRTIKGMLKIYGDYQTFIDSVEINIYVSKIDENDFDLELMNEPEDDTVNEYFDDINEEWLVLTDQGYAIAYSTDAHYEFELEEKEEDKWK